MNFSELPPELWAKILDHANYLTINKVRKTCFGLNELVKRRGLDRLHAFSAQVEKRDDCADTVVKISMGPQIFRGKFVHHVHIIHRVGGNHINDMSYLYYALFKKIRSAEKIDLYGVPVNMQLLKCLSDHSIRTKNTKLVLTNCVISINVPEANLFFAKFKEIGVYDCRLLDSLMCDQVLSVMMHNNTKLEIQKNNIIGYYANITDRLVDSIISSPYMTTCQLDMRRLQTNITFAKIKELVMTFVTLAIPYNAVFDFGHLNRQERHAVREGIEELERLQRITVFADDSRERFVFIKVFDVSQVNATTSCPVAHFTFFVREG